MYTCDRVTAEERYSDSIPSADRVAEFIMFSLFHRWNSNRRTVAVYKEGFLALHGTVRLRAPNSPHPMVSTLNAWIHVRLQLKGHHVTEYTTKTSSRSADCMVYAVWTNAPIPGSASGSSTLSLNIRCQLC